MISAPSVLLPRRAAGAAVLSILLAGSAAAQTPPVHLVADLAPGGSTAGSDPTEGIAVGGWLAFGARAGSAYRIAVTDGSTPGTVAFPQDVAEPTHWLRAGGVAVVGCGSEIWRSDGTAGGTVRLAYGEAITEVPDQGHGGPWACYGAMVSGRISLFRTDGNSRQQVRGAANLEPLISPSAITAMEWRDGLQDRRLTFLSAVGAGNVRAAWVVEGTSNAVRVGTSIGRVSEVRAYSDPVTGALHVVMAGQGSGTGKELFRYVRTPGTSTYVAQPVIEILPGPASAEPRDLVVCGDELVFTANHGGGRELFRMPFATGVPAVLDLEPGSSGSDPQGLRVVPAAAGGAAPRCVFTAATSALGRELWRYDGAMAVCLADVMPGPRGSDPQVLGFADGRIFFAADDPVVGRELWRSDGTASGTQLAFDGVPGAGSSNPTRCAVLDVGGTERLFYAAESPFGRELHAVDAATTTPQIVADLYGGPLSSSPKPFLTLADGRSVFSTNDGVWITDGTAGNATLLATTAQLGGAVATQAGESIAFDDGTCLFGVNTKLSPGVGLPVPGGWLKMRLWRSDGTPAGTQPSTTDITVQARGAYGFFEFAGGVYFGVGSSLPVYDSSRIMRTDRSGTAPVSVLGPNQSLGNLGSWVVVGDKVFLSARSTVGNTGDELYVWQPPNAPSLVADIRPGASGSLPRSLVAFRNRCYFTADDGVHGRELWSSNGLAGGTSLVLDANPGSADGLFTFASFVSVGNTLVYICDDGAHGVEPWRSNGFTGGTQMIADLRPGPLSSGPSQLTPVHVNVFACTADDGVIGRELWRIDTVQGATSFDLRPGPLGSNPSKLTWSTRHLFFTADDGVHGMEPWYASWIDFQDVGMVADMTPGSAYSSSGVSSVLHLAGPHVLFSGDGGSLVGNELHAIDAGASSTPIGTSCVQPYQTLELRSTAPRLGIGLTYWAFEPGTNVPAVTLLSLRPSMPGGLTLPGVSCPVWIDPSSYLIVDSFVTPGNFVRTIPAPSLPQILGAKMRLQVLLDYPPTLATNGLDLVFGN